MLSIWERNNFIQYHYIIIGSGIVGLTTAYYLKEKFPTKSVLILERGILPSGASTKNAGFACMGSLTELLDDLKTSSEQEVVNLFLLRKKGLERLQQLLGKEKMGYSANGSYELLFEQDIEALEKIDYLNQLLQKEINSSAFEITNDKILEFGFEQGVKALIKNRCEGEIDTGMMMKNLIQKVMSKGVEIKTGCEVLTFEDKNHEVDVHCKNPFSADEIIFTTNKLFICNNAFAKTLLPSLNIAPGRGQVLITKPIPNLPFKGIFHFHHGYYYFREYNGCVLFGGGRNLDFERETTTDFALNEEIQLDLIQKLKGLILPNHSFEIDMQWSGIMACGADKNPIINQYSENVLIGVRMGGMGVAIGSEVGFRLSKMILH
jgi:glycine/D-amino acid oxidase-like deaminating enzyme